MSFHRRKHSYPIYLGWGSNTYNETDAGFSPLAGGSAPAYYLTPIVVQLLPDPVQTLAPALSVTITSGAGGTPTAPAEQPTAVGGTFTRLHLPLAGNGQAASATMTLSYGSAWAGQSVWVEPLRGGTCTSPSVTGNATSHNGFTVTLDANGNAVLLFQPPNKPGTYKVFTRLGNLDMTYSFVVPPAGS